MRDLTCIDLEQLGEIATAQAITDGLGRDWFLTERHGPAGWIWRHEKAPASIIVSDSDPDAWGDGLVWRHASIAHQKRMPDYAELQLLHRAVWPDGYAYQCFVPPSSHVNIHRYALHLWGTPLGDAMIPDFGASGSI